MKTKRTHFISLFVMIVLMLNLLSQPLLGASYTATFLPPDYATFGWDLVAYGTSGTQYAGTATMVGWDTPTIDYAFLWNGSSSYINLNPSGYYESGANGICETQQVGWGRSEPMIDVSALLWNGSSDSYVNLHPSGFARSEAYGTNGTQQVGYAMAWDFGIGSYSAPRALLWNGSADDYIDLTPDEFGGATAKGIYGNQQVGDADGHALLWNGSADSYVDLHPEDGFVVSYAEAIYGTQQVGYGMGWEDLSYLPSHALLWNGTAESYIDLNPEGYTWTYAKDTNGMQQVGYGTTGDGAVHALLWNASAESYIDLHQYLPVNFISSSAYGIDEYGNIVGTANNGYFDCAILWQPVPEPTTLCLLGLGVIMLREK